MTEYAFDDAYQLTEETRTGSNPYSLSYTYDATGNRLTKSAWRVPDGKPSCSSSPPGRLASFAPRSRSLIREPENWRGASRLRAETLSGLGLTRQLPNQSRR